MCRGSAGPPAPRAACTRGARTGRRVRRAAAGSGPRRAHWPARSRPARDSTASSSSSKKTFWPLAETMHTRVVANSPAPAPPGGAPPASRSGFVQRPALALRAGRHPLLKLAFSLVRCSPSRRSSRSRARLWPMPWTSASTSRGSPGSIRSRSRWLEVDVQAGAAPQRPARPRGRSRSPSASRWSTSKARPQCSRIHHGEWKTIGPPSSQALSVLEDVHPDPLRDASPHRPSAGSCPRP